MGHMIKVNGHKDVEHKEGKSILESLEDCGIETLYHCREGFCGACRCKLKQGDVQYRVDPLAYIRKGEFLPCISFPTTDIELEQY